MFDFVCVELPAIVASEMQVDAKRLSILGAGFGGLGAIVAALRLPTLFRAASAFSPVCQPAKTVVGRAALGALFGAAGADAATDAKWAELDAVELLERYSGDRIDILIDVAKSDPREVAGEVSAHARARTRP